MHLSIHIILLILIAKCNTVLLGNLKETKYRTHNSHPTTRPSKNLSFPLFYHSLEIQYTQNTKAPRKIVPPPPKKFTWALIYFFTRIAGSIQHLKLQQYDLS